MIFRRIWYGLKMFWYGVTRYELFAESMFVNLSKLLEAAILVASKDKPHTTHLFFDGKRIVSFWMYPGLSKTPVDRITELLEEIEMLKEAAQRPITPPSHT